MVVIRIDNKEFSSIVRHQLNNHVVKRCLEFQFVPETVLSEDGSKEVISLMKHLADEDTVKKMKLTFVCCCNMVLNPEQSSSIVCDFPHFKDVKGLVIICFYFKKMNSFF